MLLPSTSPVANLSLSLGRAPVITIEAAEETIAEVVKEGAEEVVEDDAVALTNGTLEKRYMI